MEALTLLEPPNFKRPQTADYHAAIRLVFTLRSSGATFAYDSRMNQDAPLWRASVSRVEQTISGYAENLSIKKLRSGDQGEYDEVERFFSGKRLFVHMTERPKSAMDERWPYFLVLNASQGEYRPTFQWRLDDRSLFTRMSMALLQEKKIGFEIRLRDTDCFFRELSLSESRKSMTLLPLLGVRFWFR